MTNSEWKNSNHLNTDLIYTYIGTMHEVKSSREKNMNVNLHLDATIMDYYKIFLRLFPAREKKVSAIET